MSPGSSPRNRIPLATGKLTAHPDSLAYFAELHGRKGMGMRGDRGMDRDEKNGKMGGRERNSVMHDS